MVDINPIGSPQGRAVHHDALGRRSSMSSQFLWYLPNTVEPGHRGDTGSVDDGYGTLDYQVDLAQRVEDHGWSGALLGTELGPAGHLHRGRLHRGPDHDLQPPDRDPAGLLATRPLRLGRGHPRPAVGRPGPASTSSPGRTTCHQYGDVEGDQAERYARTKEFMRLVRRLWTEEEVTFEGEHFSVARARRSRRARWCTVTASTRGSTSAAPPSRPSGCRRPSPTSSCSGASRSTAWPSGSPG